MDCLLKARLAVRDRGKRDLEGKCVHGVHPLRIRNGMAR